MRCHWRRSLVGSKRYRGFGSYSAATAQMRVGYSTAQEAILPNWGHICRTNLLSSYCFLTVRRFKPLATLQKVFDLTRVVCCSCIAAGETTSRCDLYNQVSFDKR